MDSHEESAVLGAILASPDSLCEISYLKESDFYSESHRLIYRAIVDLSISGDPIDPISVCSKLREKRCLTRVGGSGYVAGLMDSLPDAANIKYYADKVVDQSTTRELVSIANRIIDRSDLPKSALEQAMRDIIELSERSVVTNEEPIGDISARIVSDIVLGKVEQHGIPTGFGAIDKYLMGMGAGDLILVGARPGVGKSAFALQVATHAAKDGNKVLYLSLEMTKAQLIRRLLSVESGVPYTNMLRPKSLGEDDKERISAAHKSIVALPLTIDDCPSQSLMDLRLKARRMKSKTGLDLVIVDYLQLLCAGDDNKESVTIVSKSLKGLAKDLDIPVFAVSQLSRASSYRDSSRPVLTDLRSSGQLDQDADAVIFLWHTSKDRDKVEIFIDKHRNGPLGGHIYSFDRDTTEFLEEGR